MLTCKPKCHVSKQIQELKKTFPESNPRGRRGELSKVGEEIMQHAYGIPAKKWTARTLRRRLKNYCTRREQEGSFCLQQLPVWNSVIMVLFYRFPNRKKSAAMAQEYVSILFFTMGGTLVKGFFKKLKEKERRGRGRLEDSSATLLPQGESRRGREQGGRSEVSHIAFAHRLFHPQARTTERRAGEKQDRSTTFISALCKNWGSAYLAQDG